MSELAKKKCVPCQGGTPPLNAEQMQPLFAQLESGWEIVRDHHLAKTYPFENFAQGLDYVNRIGMVAESQDHHPDLHLAWGKVGVELWTHKIEGLTESDFIFAAKCDMVFRGMQAQLQAQK